MIEFRARQTYSAKPTVKEVDPQPENPTSTKHYLQPVFHFILLGF
jgi:hypothetical protein